MMLPRKRGSCRQRRLRGPDNGASMRAYKKTFTRMRVAPCHDLTGVLLWPALRKGRLAGLQRAATAPSGSRAPSGSLCSPPPPPGGGGTGARNSEE